MRATGVGAGPRKAAPATPPHRGVPRVPGVRLCPAICWQGVDSTHHTMPCCAAKSSISWVSRMPPIREPATVRRPAGRGRGIGRTLAGGRAGQRCIAIHAAAGRRPELHTPPSPSIPHLYQTVTTRNTGHSRKRMAKEGMEKGSAGAPTTTNCTQRGGGLRWQAVEGASGTGVAAARWQPRAAAVQCFFYRVYGQGLG